MKGLLYMTFEVFKKSLQGFAKFFYLLIFYYLQIFHHIIRKLRFRFRLLRFIFVFDVF